MGRLGEALRRKQRSESGRLGFGTPAREQRRALLPGTLGGGAREASAALAAGADFAIVAAADADAAAEAARGIEGLAGADVASLAAGSADALREAGLDFVVADPEASAADVAGGELGLVLAADEASDEARLRALAALDLDAVLVREPVAALTLARRISLTRMAMLCGAPLIVAVAPDVAVADLAALRDGGAGGVVVPAKTSARKLAGLIERIEAVPPRRRARRRDDDGIALVPSASRPAGDEEPGDDDD